LNSPAPDEPINPWESSLDTSQARESNFDGDDYSISFRGNLEFSQISKYFNSTLQIGLVVPLVLISAMIWGAILVVGIGVTGLFVTALMVAVVLWFVLMRYLGSNHARRLLKRRPWLVGPIRGLVSNGRLTVWYEDVCIQSTLESFMIHPYRGMICFPDLENMFPWVMVPSSCFLEDQWHDLLASRRRSPPSRTLIVQAAPPNAWECELSTQRSFTLGNRTRALDWRPSSGLFFLALVLGVWMSFFFWVPLLVVGVWVLAEVARFTFAHWQVHREYSDPNRMAYRQESLGDQQQFQWFNTEQIVFSDLLHWVLCPARYVQRVKIRSSWIEFRIGEEPIFFHREGFADEASWQAACKDALTISQGLKKPL
jgi:hypothetical protein